MNTFLHICIEITYFFVLKMLELNGVKNIIFDLGGVILNIDYNRTANAFKNIGVTNFDKVCSQAKQNKVFDDLETGKLSPPEFRDYLKKEQGLLSDADIDNAWNAMLLDLPKKRVELLEKLKINYRIFLLSNTNKIHIKAFQQIVSTSYKGSLFDTIFEQHYYSSEIGMRKPNADCFEFVLNSNNLEASETLFIDDSIQHIEGAKKIGLKTYYLKAGEDITTLFLGKVR